MTYSQFQKCSFRSIWHICMIDIKHCQQLATTALLCRNPCLLYPVFLSEIPSFLTEEECRVVVQLAQLKGLMESQTAASTLEQEESNQPLLSLSTEEVFSLLDLNQDGLIQKEEVNVLYLVISVTEKKSHWINKTLVNSSKLPGDFLSDCESLTIPRWNVAEPGEVAADAHWSGSQSSRSVPLWVPQAF